MDTFFTYISIASAVVALKCHHPFQRKFAPAVVTQSSSQILLLLRWFSPSSSQGLLLLRCLHILVVEHIASAVFTHPRRRTYCFCGGRIKMPPSSAQGICLFTVVFSTQVNLLLRLLHNPRRKSRRF